jgi:hypothetical protein
MIAVSSVTPNSEDAEMSNNYKHAVGDKVRLLKGGARGTHRKPPLIEGEVYTIEEICLAPAIYRLGGPASRVMEEEVELVEKAHG